MADIDLDAMIDAAWTEEQRRKAEKQAKSDQRTADVRERLERELREGMDTAFGHEVIEALTPSYTHVPPEGEFGTSQVYVVLHYQEHEVKLYRALHPPTGGRNAMTDWTLVDAKDTPGPTTAAHWRSGGRDNDQFNLLAFLAKVKHGIEDKSIAE